MALSVTAGSRLLVNVNGFSGKSWTSLFSCIRRRRNERGSVMTTMNRFTAIGVHGWVFTLTAPRCGFHQQDRAELAAPTPKLVRFPPRGVASANALTTYIFTRNAFPIAATHSGLSHSFDPRTFCSTRPFASTSTVKGIALAPNIFSSVNLLSR